MIGAGVGGLAVAARLCAQGHTVTVVESSERTGGKLASYARDGFVFDTGPSLLTLPAVYRDLFLKTGDSLESCVDLVAVDDAFGYRWADGTEAKVPGTGVVNVASALGQALGGDAEQDWRELMARASRMWEATRATFVESPVEGVRTLVRESYRVGQMRTIAPLTSLRRLGRHTLHDSRLVTLLDRYATYTGSDPRRSPAVLATIPYIESTFGVWHIGGGMHQLAAALRSRCDESGVRFRLSNRVSRVEVEGARVAGVTLDGTERINADIVVSDIDASTLYGRLLNDPRRSGPLRHLRRLDPSLSGFTLLLAVRGRTAGISHHNVWFPADYDAEFDSIFGGQPHPVEDPTVYACVPDDAAMRPDAQSESWSVLVNAPRHDPGHGVNWSEPKLAIAYADRILDLLAARGVDIRERVLWREIRTPADLERETGAPGGAIYGSSSNGARAAFLRPTNRSPVPGLFLVGGSAHPGGGLPLVGMSAAIVADMIGRA